MVPADNPNQSISTKNVVRKKVSSGCFNDMAAVDAMGEVDEMPSAEDNFKKDVALNGEEEKEEEELVEDDALQTAKKISNNADSHLEPLVTNSSEIEEKVESLEVKNDEIIEKNDDKKELLQETVDDSNSSKVNEQEDGEASEEEEDDEDDEEMEEKENGDIENEEVSESQEIEGDKTELTKEENQTNNVLSNNTDNEKEVDEPRDPLSSDDDGDSDNVKEVSDEVVSINDSKENNSDVVVEEGKENSSSDANQSRKHKLSEGDEVIDLDAPVKKKKKMKTIVAEPSRRSSRNLNKERKSYVEEEEYVAAASGKRSSKKSESGESDIEEILPEDPLAVSDSAPTKRSNSPSSTIVVKDTKRLVEIASQSNSSNLNKKEPTLVIIDTNSILSGRGPIPIAQKPSASSSSTINSSSFPMIPMALSSQGVYSSNMRATITPIPITTSSGQKSLLSTGQSPILLSTVQSNSAVHMSPVIHPPPLVQAPAQTTQAQQLATVPPLLPTLTDDMFVVEAPSFIVPYVYEKPPVKDLKEFLKEAREKDAEEKKKKKEEEEEEKKKEDEEKMDVDVTKQDEDLKGDSKKKSKKEDSDEDYSDEEKDSKKKSDDKDAKDAKESEEDKKNTESGQDDSKKTKTYFDTPLGNFFVDLGLNLVQEFFQNDLLRQQKRKRDREQGQNSVTNKTIETLIKNLEFSKENNEPFRMEMKKCQFCSFKTESSLAMAFHLETPHMKNYVYRCNFCSYEIRSPHDILFHMESEHGVRGRLERAPAFHQCPSCPFEDNQKGKLSRHLTACARKFRPEHNLDPPGDWDPPAKIPRAPRSKQTGLNATAAMYQAMAQRAPNPYQIMQKIVNQQSGVQMVHRGRGRPSLGTVKTPPNLKNASGMMYKQMSGGSVFVPTNYPLTGNQVFQVVGGQEIGARLASIGGSTAFVPNLAPAPPNSVTIQQQTQQQNQSSTKSKPVQQPSISITPLPRGGSSNSSSTSMLKPGDSNAKNSFVICEICDGYIKDLEQLRNHMQWIHKVKIHPKMIYNRPPLNCQKCQFRFFTDQGLERHLLGSHGLVTSSMQEAANKSKDAGRCPVCGRVYQWKLLNHVARDHNMALKPAHLSYKCTVCTATFGMYKQFENHVYSAHSVVAKRVMDKKSGGSNSVGSGGSSSSSKGDTLLKPLKINDEITIIPQPAKSQAVKDGVGSRIDAGSSKTLSESSLSLLSRAERLVRQKTATHSRTND